MEKIKISLKKIEYQELIHSINESIFYSQSELHYIDYYNVKTLIKKIFDKLWKISNLSYKFHKKEYQININLNEFDSLVRLHNFSQKTISTFASVIYEKIFFQSNSQIKIINNWLPDGWMVTGMDRSGNGCPGEKK